MEKKQVVEWLENNIVLVAVSLLFLLAVVFLVLSERSSMPEQCSFPPGVTCDSFSASPDKLTLVLHNSLDNSLHVLALYDTEGSCFSTAATIKPESSEKFLFENCTHGTIGDKMRTNIELTYPVMEGNLTVNATAKGLLVAKLKNFTG